MRRRIKHPNLVPGMMRGQRIVTPTSPPGVVGVWRGPNLLADGDMEAVGTAAWSPAGGPTLSKETSSPAEGTQWFKLLNGTGMAATMEAQQFNVITIGQTYRLTGWGRGDGIENPTIRTAGGVGSQIYAGTTSTSWQEIDVTWTELSGTGFKLRLQNGAPGTFIGFDGLYLSLE